LVPQRIDFPKGCFLRGMVSWRVGFPEVCSPEGFPQRDAHQRVASQMFDFLRVVS